MSISKATSHPMVESDLSGHPVRGLAATGYLLSARVVAGWAVLLVALLIYWAFLLQSNHRHLADAEDQARLRGMQTAQALAAQVESMTRDIDHIARNMALAWSAGDEARLRQVLDEATAALPEGALVQVSVADASGNMAFSSLGLPEGRKARVSIADREHFKVHGAGIMPALYISHAVFGRVSQRWSVQFSRPVMKEGAFVGVVVISISPEYLAQSFRQIFPEPGDVVALLRTDGAYLTRSQRLHEVLGTRVPDTRPFIRIPDMEHGSYDAIAAVDGVERFYAWRRVAYFPLVVSLGLHKGKAMAGAAEAIDASVLHNAFGSALLVLAAVWITWLFRQKRRDFANLNEIRERLELALQGGDLGSWDWDLPSGRILGNARWALMLGYAGDEAEHDINVLSKLAHPEDWEEAQAALQAYFRGECEHYEADYRLRHRDGRWIWVHSRGQVVARDENGAPLRMVGTHLDITERKQAEARERDLQARLSKLVAQVPGLVFQYLERSDGSACFPYASPGIVDIYGVSPEEATRSADKVFGVIHPDDLQKVQASIRESAADLSIWRCEYRVCLADGRVRWLLGLSNPERTAEGGTLWHGYIQDVSDAHAAADALRQSEERLRLTVAAVQDGLWEWDLDTGRMQWDARCHAMMGYTEGAVEPTYEAFMALVHPRDQMRVRSSLSNQIRLRPDDVATEEFRVQNGSGDWLWIEWRGSVVGREDGGPKRMIGTITDVTQRVAANQFRRALLDQNAAAIVLSSADRHVRYANVRAHQIFARAGDSLQGVSLRTLHVSDASWQAMGENIKPLREQGYSRFEYPLRDAGGMTRWFDMHGTPLDREQPDSEMLWTLVDITERKAAEAALIAERTRLTALLERFPGGVLLEDAADRIVMANQGLCELLSVPLPASALAGMTRQSVCEQFPALDLKWLQLDAELQDGLVHTFEVDAAGRQSFEVDWVKLLHGEARLGHVWLVRDITGRKLYEKKLASLAATDPLTALSNRRSFMAELERTVAGQPSQDGHPGALLMLDIDHFKRVNDRYGHPVGDRVLKHLADVITRVLRRDDVAGRLGGEEFAIVLRGTSNESAFGLAERLRRAVCNAPLDHDSGPIQITISIGLAVFDGAQAESMLARADQALYEAKEGGRNRVCMWSGIL
ncbi:PAS domain-containing protein [Azoarcus sp. L1K30]|uniref:PAS domain-containing protein n=1 Tax=Azoarcus sp. L1K30 TaxID=2820277 RepID=UPI001B80FB1F|nr:PAS domain-containing protein [Azoarcus sp. L1K30]MBR0567147.1 PAS domain-containing protein [Azoarcus sp. L1K30]